MPETLTRTFCIRNLATAEVVDADPFTNPKPTPAFRSKEEYRRWCNDPRTDHLFLSFYEGEVASMRVTKDNRPIRVHGFLADFDAYGLTDEEIRSALRRALPYAPHAIKRTFSGGLRMAWIFEEPVFYYNAPTWKRFVKRLVQELKCPDLAAGYDDCGETANMYQTAGDGWVLVPHSLPVPAAALHLWASETAKADDFSGFGVEIPLDLVAAEMERKFPGRWTGGFEEGARGVRFWDPTADAKASIVRKTGMQCFTGDRPFMTWADIFGREFVARYMEDRLGAAIRDLHYDGKAFWRQLPDERWDPMDTSTCKRHLTVHYGLCPKVPKDDNESEVDRALHRIETAKRVAGAFPFPHRPERLVNFNRETYLNTANNRLWPAAMDEQEWGANFPWIAAYLSALFPGDKTLPVFISWLHVWIKSLYEGSPRKGHALFIVGPPGTGKTFLMTQIVSRIVGGSCEATQYLVGGNRYNNALFNVALWTIDDALPGANPKAHATFSALVKAVVANNTFPYDRKYGQSGDVPFDGRLAVTLNDDPNSKVMIPDTDLSLLDKIILLRTGDVPADMAMEVRERYETVERELSAFVRWVLDYEVPDWIEREARFGIRAWHDEGLLAEARSVTVSGTVMEAVSQWRGDYARSYPDREVWEGTPSELLALLRQHQPTELAVERINPTWFGRYLGQALANGTEWLSRGRRGSDDARVIRMRLR